MPRTVLVAVTFDDSEAAKYVGADGVDHLPAYLHARLEFMPAEHDDGEAVSTRVAVFTERSAHYIASCVMADEGENAPDDVDGPALRSELLAASGTHYPDAEPVRDVVI